jgi:hypothetical protein
MMKEVFRAAVRRIVPPHVRHLVHSELNMVRADGIAWTLRWNAILSDAWLRNLLNRRHYRRVSEVEVKRWRKSDTVFIFGSGASLNDISAADWAHIAEHDVFGFNAFYHQRWIPVNFHLLRGGLYREHRWRRYASEVVDTIRMSPYYRDTVFIMQEEFLAQFTNQLIGYRLFPDVKGLVRYTTANGAGRLPSQRLSEGLRHLSGTLSDAVNCAFCLGWRHIVLAGVDLYDSRYFWLPADQTSTVDRVNATMGAAPANALGGTRYDDRHYTTRNGVVDLMAEWRSFFETRGVTLSVYNPRSLLADVLPVYSPHARAVANQGS